MWAEHPLSARRSILLPLPAQACTLAGPLAMRGELAATKHSYWIIFKAVCCAAYARIASVENDEGVLLWRSYTFCGDGLSPDSPPSLLAGMGCTYNQSRAQKVGSEVHISTSMNMSNHRTCATPPIGYLPEVRCSAPSESEGCSHSTTSSTVSPLQQRRCAV